MKKIIYLFLAIFLLSLVTGETHAIITDPIFNFDDGGGGEPSTVEITFNVDPNPDYKSSMESTGHMWLKITNHTGGDLEVGRMTLLDEQSVTLSGNSSIDNSYPLYIDGYYVPTHVPLVTYNLENLAYNSSSSSFSGIVLTMKQIVSETDFEDINNLITYYTYHGAYSTEQDLSLAWLSDIGSIYEGITQKLSEFLTPGTEIDTSLYSLSILNVLQSILAGVDWDLIYDYVYGITQGDKDLYSLAVEYEAFESAAFDQLVDSGMGYILDNPSLKLSYRNNLVNLFYDGQEIEYQYSSTYPYEIDPTVAKNINRLRYTGYFLNFTENRQSNGLIAINKLLPDTLDNINLAQSTVIPGTCANTNFAITIWNYASALGLDSSYDREHMLFYPMYETFDAYDVIQYILYLVPSDHYDVYYTPTYSGSTYGGILDGVKYEQSFAPTVSVFGYYMLYGFINLTSWNEWL